MRNLKFNALAAYTCLGLTLACGVGSITAPTTSANLFSRLTIKKADVSFYNATYTGSEWNCFPPPGQRIVSNPDNRDIYKITQEIRMEMFEIQVIDRSYTQSVQVKELAHLVASELALQRKFSKFTVTRILDISSSSSYYTIDTYGTSYGNTYQGNSYLNQNTSVSSLHTFTILFYDEQEPIDRGIFIKYNSGFLKRLNIQPYRYLYRGTTPIDAQELPQKMNNTPGTYMFETIPTNAWKVHFEAAALSDALKAKYGMQFTEPLKFTDEREEEEKRLQKRQDDPLEKFKVKKQ